MKPLVLLAALLLSGCAGNPIHKALDEAAAKQDDAKCRDFGATPGTQAYFDCRMKMDSDRNAHAESMSNAIADASRQRQQSMDANNAALYQALRPPVTCTSQRTLGIGNPVVTQCQ